MSCAACAARVEKAVRAVPGVESCAVSLLTNSMGVEGTADPAAVVAAVTKAGYGASPKSAAGAAQTSPACRGGGPASRPVEGYVPSTAAAPDPLADTETPRLKKRLFWSLGFLLVLMYVSMGHMMWGFPLPKWFEGNHVAMGLVQLLLAGIVMVINQRFFISGFKALLHRAPNMDTLVSLGSAASFGWSVWVLFAMTRAQADGDAAAVEAYMMEFYFESAAMILTLITVGKMLEAKSKGRTTDALKGLMKLAPQTATVLRDGAEVTVPVAQVQKDDVFIVRPGESVPVDGVVIEGSSAVNESALTGESIPVDKAPGDPLSAATVNQSGWLKARATRVGEDTTLNQIIKMVSDAAATKAPIAKVADKVSGIFVPAVLAIAVVVTTVWLFAGRDFSYALGRGISVLVISCPCALGLATPVAIMVGSGVGAKNGILFKTAVSLEQTGKVKLVALDKTGTVTTGRPAVTDVLPAEGVTEDELLTAALALESRSEHPLAKAIVAFAQATGDALQAFPLGGRWHGEAVTDEGTPRQADAIDQTTSTNNVPSSASLCSAPSPQGEGNGFPDVENFRALPGNGLEATLNGRPLIGGSVKFLASRFELPSDLLKQSEDLANQGKTPVLFAHGDRLLGLIAVADTLKPESPEAVRDLQNMGLKVIMLTGDNERTAKAIAAQAGVDEVIAGVLPEGKEAVIRELQQRGPVLMVGDGINDAPALTRADVGVAIGAGTDVAIDAADVVLMKSKLSDVPAALRLSRATLRNIHENLFWAFIYNTVGIPLAAGAFVKAFGWTLSPMFGAAAMSLSSFCVVTNALRLNLVKLGSGQQATGNRDQGSGNRPARRGGSYPQGEPPAPPKAEDDAPVGTSIACPPSSAQTLQISVKGMMCHNCERHVREALEALPGVESAEADFQTGLVTVHGTAEEKEMKTAVKAAGYKFQKIVK
jgi:Cu2+-exporting ATPase